MKQFVDVCEERQNNILTKSVEGHLKKRKKRKKKNNIN